MKKYILTGLMALAGMFSASAIQKMYVDMYTGCKSCEKPYVTRIYDAALVDSVVHQPKDTTSMVEVCMSSYKNKDFYFLRDYNIIDKVYFSGYQGIDGSIISVSECVGNPWKYTDTLATYQYDSTAKTMEVTLHGVHGSCCGTGWVAYMEVYSSSEVRLVPIELGDRMCNCVCRYDVTFLLTDVESRSYNFHVDDQSFEVDLSKAISGVAFVQQQLSCCLPAIDSVKSSSCKNELAGQDAMDATSLATNIGWNRALGASDTLVYYKFDGNAGTGTIVSYNILLNCCAEISSLLQVKNDTISILSIEAVEDSLLACDCICTYDVTTTLKKLSAQKYHFIVDGAEFDVDLSPAGIAEGFVKVGPRGAFLRSSECKMNDLSQADGLADSIPQPASDTLMESPRLNDSQILVSYQFNVEKGTGVITSLNQVLNCCAERGSEVSVSNDTIVIRTVENLQRGDDGELLMCDCICTFDITTQLAGLEKKWYHFFVDGTEFSVDLSAGSHELSDTIRGGMVYKGPRGFFAKSSPCKGSVDGADDWESEEESIYPPTRAMFTDTLVSYWYDPQTKELTIVSYNQKKHCCAVIGSTVSMNQDTISVTTIEGGDICRCWCLYDVTTKIIVSEPGSFHFNVDGIEFDLAFGEGGYAGNILRELRGSFLESSACKKQRDADVPERPAEVEKNSEKDSEEDYYITPSRTEGTDTLVSYHYDPSTGICLIVSYGVELNCCGEISSVVTMTGDRVPTIYIQGLQTGEQCKCLCSYDITSKLTSVTEREYRFIVDGTKFIVDFSKETDGFVTK
ncbi:MAG: hypothetical protein J6Y37_04765 [Paludibacteraceae bacterium]|nr:hypothetical protein [Paludibacteraceae bacterium]